MMYDKDPEIRILYQTLDIGTTNCTSFPVYVRCTSVTWYITWLRRSSYLDSSDLIFMTHKSIDWLDEKIQFVCSFAEFTPKV